MKKQMQNRCWPPGTIYRMLTWRTWLTLSSLRHDQFFNYIPLVGHLWLNPMRSVQEAEISRWNRSRASLCWAYDRGKSLPHIFHHQIDRSKVGQYLMRKAVEKAGRNGKTLRLVPVGIPVSAINNIRNFSPKAVVSNSKFWYEVRKKVIDFR